MAKEDSRRPKDGWRQLKFRTFLCVPNALCGVYVFGLMFIVSLILCGTILSFSYKISEYESEAIDFPHMDNPTLASMSVGKKMTGPVYIYLKYMDYHQNHRIYLKSKSKEQLAGKSSNSMSTDCAPIYRYKDIGYLNLGLNETNSSDGTVFPCGLLPASFVKLNVSIGYNMTFEDIYWKLDDDSKYKRRGDEYLNVLDPHFRVWMRTGATKNVKKLYGKVDEDIAEGDVNITIDQISPNYLGYEPKLRVILSTTTRIGGKSMVLGWVFFVVMIMSLVWTILFYVAYGRAKNSSSRNLRLNT